MGEAGQLDEAGAGNGRRQGAIASMVSAPTLRSDGRARCPVGRLCGGFALAAVSGAQVVRGQFEESLRVVEGARRERLSPGGVRPGGQAAGVDDYLPEL